MTPRVLPPPRHLAPPRRPSAGPGPRRRIRPGRLPARTGAVLPTSASLAAADKGAIPKRTSPVLVGVRAVAAVEVGEVAAHVRSSALVSLGQVRWTMVSAERRWLSLSGTAASTRETERMWLLVCWKRLGKGLEAWAMRVITRSP
jgi:hypothetical protein